MFVRRVVSSEIQAQHVPLSVPMYRRVFMLSQSAESPLILFLFSSSPQFSLSDLVKAYLSRVPESRNRLQPTVNLSSGSILSGLVMIFVDGITAQTAHFYQTLARGSVRLWVRPSWRNHFGNLTVGLPVGATRASSGDSIVSKSAGCPAEYGDWRWRGV